MGTLYTYPTEVKCITVYLLKVVLSLVNDFKLFRRALSLAVESQLGKNTVYYYYVPYTL